MPKEIKNNNQSVGKALQIIESLSHSIAPMRLQDIAKSVDMPTSTALRMIASLMEYGYVGQDPDTKKYYLTLKFAKIGSIVNSRFSIRDVAHPKLLLLSQECGEAACIAVENNMWMVYVDVTDGPDGMLKIMQYIGKRSPMHCTGVGKCLLLNYSQQQLQQLIAEVGLGRFTANTITTEEGLLEELKRTRERGFAIDDQECEMGARCLAAPIWDYSGKVVAAISVSGPIDRMTYSRLETVSKIVVRIASEISAELSFNDP